MAYSRKRFFLIRLYERERARAKKKERVRAKKKERERVRVKKREREIERAKMDGKQGEGGGG